MLAAAKAFYSTPLARKDGGDFQPGLHVIANDGRLEAVIQGGGAAVAFDKARALRLLREHGYRDPQLTDDDIAQASGEPGELPFGAAKARP